MTTELLANLWRINQLAAGASIQQLTPDTYRNRLTPSTASAGFIALHTTEAIHSFAKIIFGRDVTIERKIGRGATDNGQPIDLPAVQQMTTDALFMHHNSYHAGQITQADKEGKCFDLVYWHSRVTT